MEWLGFNSPAVVVRRDISRQRKFVADAESISLIQWQYTSTVMPCQHRHVMKSRLKNAVAAATAASATGTRFLALVAISGDQGEGYLNLSALEISKERSEVFRKLGRVQRKLPSGVKLALAAAHVGVLLDGRTRQHTHVLVSVETSSDAPVDHITAVFEAAGLLVCRAGGEAQPHWVDDHLEAHLTYLFGFPLSFYTSAVCGAKMELEQALRCMSIDACKVTPAFVSLLDRSNKACRTIKLYGIFRCSSVVSRSKDTVTTVTTYSPDKTYESPIEDEECEPCLLHVGRRLHREYPDIEVTFAVFFWPGDPPSHREVEMEFPLLKAWWEKERAAVSAARNATQFQALA